VAEGLLRCEREGHVAVITFDDPSRMNAMTEAMGRALAEAARSLAEDERVRAVVLTGAGRAFSAGGDLGMIESMAREASAEPGEASRERHRAFMRRFYELYLSVRSLPQPTIAAVNGHAVGAGCCVALACDLRVVAREAKLSLNFARLGIHPGMAATWTLPRLVGPAMAAELLFTGRAVEGEEAHRLGLANRAVAAERVLEEARALAADAAASAPLAVRGIKRALAHTERASLAEQLDFEASEQALCYASRDLAEGLSAARERRPPRFEGR
jgi:enoyl-CoA hydratase